MKTRVILSVLVVVGLSAAGWWVGLDRLSHWTGLGGHAHEHAADACEVHGVASCPFCDPALIEALGGCAGHGVPEALCSRCRPGLERAFRLENDWCDGHGLPESQCLLCNPELAADPYGGAVEPDAHDGHAEVVVLADTPRRQRPPAVSCETERSVLRFANGAVAAHAGLELSTVRREPLREERRMTAQLAYDARKYANLASRASGVVSRVLVDAGARVRAGEALLHVDAPELGAARAALLAADARVQLWERNTERERGLRDEQLTTESAVLQAEASLAESRIARDAARQRLRSLGLDAAAVDATLAHGEAGATLVLTAPFDGQVVALHAVQGEPARPAETLLAVADTSRLWALLDAPPDVARLVQPGQAVLLELDGAPSSPIAGRVSWVSPEVDPRTRTVRVRAEVDNPHGQRRAGEFGSARVVVRDGRDAVLVPREAVQWEGCCNVAFVRHSEVEFEPRRLHLGVRTGEAYEVLDGLEVGESVVTRGSFLLKTELLKGSIGAGCCEVEPAGD